MQATYGADSVGCQQHAAALCRTLATVASSVCGPLRRQLCTDAAQLFKTTGVLRHSSDIVSLFHFCIFVRACCCPDEGLSLGKLWSPFPEGRQNFATQSQDQPAGAGETSPDFCEGDRNLRGVGGCGRHQW